jgi:hypothetical protein
LEDGYCLIVPTVSKPKIEASDKSVRNNVKENGLANLAGVACVETGWFALDEVSLFAPDKFRTHNTDAHVLKRVKKNPPMITYN